MQDFEAVGEAGQVQRLAPGQPARGVAERQPQIARRLLHAIGERLELGGSAAGGAQLRAGIARDLDQLGAGNGLAEEQARRFRQLVRFVEDHRVARRQELGNAFVAQHHVGKKEMMVDHHDVGGERVAARTHHEAIAVVRATLAEAVVARRGGVRPDRRILRHVGEIGAIAGGGAGGEALDAPQLARLLARGDAGCGAAPQAVEADVVGATLEQRGARARGQRLAHRRQVAIEELVLQRLGAGRDDDFAAGKQRGNQVRERLPGAGARLGDQHLGALDRLVDRLRHLELLRPPLEAVDCFGERPLGCKGVLQPGVQSSASTMTQTRVPISTHSPSLACMLVASRCP